MLAGHTCSTDTGPLALVALKNTRKRKKIESEIQTFFEVKKNEADEEHAFIDFLNKIKY